MVLARRSAEGVDLLREISECPVPFTELGILRLAGEEVRVIRPDEPLVNLVDELVLISKDDVPSDPATTPRLRSWATWPLGT